jgi:hypothetical protein
MTGRRDAVVRFRAFCWGLKINNYETTSYHDDEG